MKSSRKMTALIVSGGVALLAVSLPGQSAGAGSSPSNSTPDSRRPSSPNTPHDPTASGASSPPSSPRRTTKSSADSTTESSSRPYEPNTINAAASATNPANSGVNPNDAIKDGNRTATGAPGMMPWLTEFKTYDKDSDGRLSLNEFLLTSSSPSRGEAGMSGSNGTTPEPRTINPADPTNPANSTTGLRNAPPGSASDPMRSSSAPVVSPTSPVGADVRNRPGSETSIRQVFRQLDTNHDNYVTPAELESYRINSSTPPPR